MTRWRPRRAAKRFVHPEPWEAYGPRGFVGRAVTLEEAQALVGPYDDPCRVTHMRTGETWTRNPGWVRTSPPRLRRAPATAAEAAVVARVSRSEAAREARNAAAEAAARGQEDGEGERSRNWWEDR